ncbi:alpha-L-fucosidase [Gilvimarinus polysaccharolyticus]|uniref:alpha-L-fucosidase n=1 Tax=Gilvimarinus polysaccharolyticus TaxID=863921 RepID=UPI0006739802|nr:alpha-L-fucosidase [Gilvimarinus polysaccharolyticus]
MKNNIIKIASLSAVSLLLSTNLAIANGEPSYTADEKSLAQHYAAPDWFRDAKLGIYFTWGPYTVAAHANEWYPRWMHFDFSDADWKGREKGYHIDALPWHTENFGHPSEFGYHDMISQFTAENFDAAEWAELFEQTGAKFAGPVAMHHDGYALWDSNVTPWNSADIGPKRDIMGELFSELRKRDMKTIATFHHARHLQRYKGQNIQQAMQRYGHLEPYHAYWNSHYPWIEGLPTTSENPKLKLLYGNLPEDQWLEEFWLGALQEVTDKYQPDIVWFDTWLDQIPESTRYEFAAYYLNAGTQWGKPVMMTHKDRDMPETFSVEDFEQGRRDKLTGAPWLTDDTLSKWSWSYIEGLEIKPARWVIHDFIDIVSKNGQLLLNISPKADGSIPEDQRTVLKALGDWLKVNGEAIYNTRPWKIYGEGPTQMTGDGHFSEHVDYTPEDIRFTQNGDNLYAITLGTPDKAVNIAVLAKNNSIGVKTFRTVTALNGDYIESWSQDSDGLKITLKKDAPQQIAYAFKLN